MLDIDVMRRELEELVQGEEIGMVRLPPGTKTERGRDVGGMWAFGSLVPPAFVRYHIGSKKELERKLKAASSQRLG